MSYEKRVRAMRLSREAPLEPLYKEGYNEACDDASFVAADADEEVQSLKAENRKMRTTLRRVEFGSHQRNILGQSVEVCPYCHNPRSHQPDCKLGKLLSRPECRKGGE